MTQHVNAAAALADWEAELAPHYEVAERMLGVVSYDQDTPADLLLGEYAQEHGFGETYNIGHACSMRRTPVPGKTGCMQPNAPCRLTLDATIDHSVIRGTLITPTGHRRYFHDWLELNTALEAILDSGQTTTADEARSSDSSSPTTEAGCATERLNASSDRRRS